VIENGQRNGTTYQTHAFTVGQKAKDLAVTLIKRKVPDCSLFFYAFSVFCVNLLFSPYRPKP